jgi:DNA-binding MltR family transcriptional regulator
MGAGGSGATPYLRAIHEALAHADNGRALILVSALSACLEQAIRAKMVKLPKDLDKGLFQGAYGPLAHFKARIDIAFALGLITAEMRKDLDIMRNVRNQIAHPEDAPPPSFKSSKIIEQCKKLSGMKASKKGSAEEAYLLTAMAIVEHLRGVISRSSLMATLRRVTPPE